MDVVLIELVLWVGLLFFFWALKEGLSHVESDIDSLGLVHNVHHAIHTDKGIRFYQPERVAEPIGTYRGTQIYRYAVIQGQTYQFDHICPIDGEITLAVGERCVAPGLVYQECSVPGQLVKQA